MSFLKCSQWGLNLGSCVREASVIPFDHLDTLYYVILQKSYSFHSAKGLNWYFAKHRTEFTRDVKMRSSIEIKHIDVLTYVYGINLNQTELAFRQRIV